MRLMTRDELRAYFARAKAKVIEKKEIEQAKAERVKTLKEARAKGLPAPKPIKPKPSVKVVPKAEEQIFEAVKAGINTTEAILQHTGYSIVTVRNGLARLAIRGLIDQGPCIERAGQRGRRRFTFFVVEQSPS